MVAPLTSLPRNAFEIESSSILALGTDSTIARACLLESVNRQHRLISWSEEKRAASQHLGRQFESIIKQMGQQLGRTLWDPQQQSPLLHTDNVVRMPPLLYIVAAASPRSTLNVWLMGLDQERSIGAATEAIASSPAQIIGSTILTPATSGGEIGHILTTAQPDVVVISGGYESNSSTITELIRRLCQHMGDGLLRLSPSQHPAVIYAANSASADEAAETLQAASPNLTIEIVANVQPTPHQLNPVPLTSAVSGIYQERTQKTSAYNQLQTWVTPPASMMSLEASFIRLARSWRLYKGLHELHALYRTTEQWLHVWVREQEGSSEDVVKTLYTSPGHFRSGMNEWPALQLVSGAWPQRQWQRPQQSWCDPSGMAPVVAAVGQVAPQAMLQVLDKDLLY